MSGDSHLRYLPATRVDTPMGSLGTMSLVSPSDKNVGTVDGVIIDPTARKVLYFVVKLRRWWSTHQYLLSFSPAKIDSERTCLHVDLEPGDVQQLPKFHAGMFPSFSDEDFISFLFAPRTA